MSKSDRQHILTVLQNVMEFEKKKDPQGENKLLHQERLLLIATEYLADGLGIAEVPFNFSQSFIEYILIVNGLAMDNFHAGNTDKAIHYLLKAIDLLMSKSLHKFVKPIQKYGEMKVLTFNNLACIYQKRKQLLLALKSVSFALELEEKLVSDNSIEAKTSIISTLLNKAAIQNSLNKHDKAQESLFKALLFIEKRESELQTNEEPKKKSNEVQKEEIKENANEIQKEEAKENSNEVKNEEIKVNPLNVQNEEVKEKSKDVQNPEEEKALQTNQKAKCIHDIKHLKMMCYYNIGAEDEHLLHSDRAKQNYQKSKVIADELNDQIMKERLQKILDSFK